LEGESTAKARAILLAIALAASIGGVAPASAAHRHPALDRSGRERSGLASFYGHRRARALTASGALYDPARMTAASRTLPFGTRARVTNLDNGRTADVIINDRGRFDRRRILDVSPAAARRLGIASLSRVKVRPLSMPPADETRPSRKAP
jgi:rare lipoprotein A